MFIWTPNPYNLLPYCHVSLNNRVCSLDVFQCLVSCQFDIAFIVVLSWQSSQEAVVLFLCSGESTGFWFHDIAVVRPWPPWPLSGLCRSRRGCRPQTWRVRWGSPRTTRSSPRSAARPGSARWAHTCLGARRPHLTLRLGCEILLEPGVGLLRGVVGGQQEGHCVPQQTLVMQRRRTRLNIYFYLSFKYFLYINKFQMLRKIFLSHCKYF